ncbi:MAG: hypothetical protein ACHQAQ_00520 [Hyphomicrobiales bacterium]
MSRLRQPGASIALVFGVRRGRTDLLEWLNTFVCTVKNEGALEAISRKWREAPLGIPAVL